MPRFVLSASRRSDIPAFYMPWFMASVDRGVFEVVNPYNRKVSRVPSGPDHVHSIVFWSKDFGPFLRGDYGRRLQREGYGLFFNFTINSHHRALEPCVPPLGKRLDQLDELSSRFGPNCINWRFDPICFFKTADGRISANLDQFDAIAARAANAGIGTCISSMVDPYRKVLNRFHRHSTLKLVDPPVDRKLAAVHKLAGTLTALGIELHLCCERALLEALPAGVPARGSSCIPGRRLAALFGPDISLARDAGQRRTAGCRCTVSKDIGSYSLHPCYHNCLFCYANPIIDRSNKSQLADG